MTPCLLWLTSLPLSLAELSFEQWAEAHEKVYDPEEWRGRAAIYAANLLRVQHLGEGYAVGPFGDLAPEEFVAKLMPKRPAPALLEEHREQLEVIQLPDAFDWDKKGLVAPVRNQKALGSCWAVSTAEAVEGQVAKMTGKLLPMSPEQLVECDASSDSSCGGGKGCADCGMFGGWPYLAYQFLQKAGGMFSEDDWPYYKEGMFPCMPKGYNKAFCGNHDDLYCRANSTKGQGPADLCHASGFATPVTGWRSLSSDEKQLAAQLVQYGPLSVLLLADGLQFYHSGVWTGGLLGCKPDPAAGILSLNHAVLMVGYGEEKGILGSKAYWRLKNSWGVSWGEQGFFRMLRGTGLCGVNLAPTVARIDSVVVV